MCLGKVKPLKFVKKHPLEAVALAATAAIGGPAIMGALGGGTAASGAAGGIASLLGPSELTAALAGDAFMPAALGAAGSSAPGIGSTLGAKFASGSMGSTLGNLGKAAKVAGLLTPQPQGPMGAPPPPSAPVPPTNLSQQGLLGTPPTWGAVGGNEDERLKAIMAMLQQQGRA